MCDTQTNTHTHTHTHTGTPRPPSSFNEYGTVLHIKSVEYTPDGRSLVTTVGEKRFRVLKHWKEDGLHQAKVEYLEDEVLTGEHLGECVPCLHE